MIMGFVRDFTIEFFSSMIVTLFSCAVCQDDADSFEINLVYGLTSLFVLHCFGTITGGHGNPSVTALSYILDDVPLLTALNFAIAQLLGGIFGIFLLDGYILKGAAEKCTLEATGSTNALFFIEFIATSVYLLVWLALWDDRFAFQIGVRMIHLTLAHIGLAVIVVPFGGSLNILRVLSPAMVSKNFKNVGINLLSHVAALTTSSILWKRLMSSSRRPLKPCHSIGPFKSQVD